MQAQVEVPESDLEFIDAALQGATRTGTMAWRLIDFPLDQVQIRAKTGSAEVYGKQSTSWVASYTKDYVVVMMVSQGGTGSGTSGPAIRKIYETLYGVRGDKVVDATTPPSRARAAAELPGVRRGRLDPAAASAPRARGRQQGEAQPMTDAPPRSAPARCRVDGPSLARVPRLDWMLLLAVGRAARDRHAAGLVGHRPSATSSTGGDPQAFLRSTWSTSRSASCSRCSSPPPTTGGCGSSRRWSTSPR